MRFRRIDAGADDGGVPEALAVARRQVVGIQTKLGHDVGVPAQLLERSCQFAPGDARRNERAVFFRDAPADGDVQQTQKMAVRDFAVLEFGEEFGQRIHTKASGRAFYPSFLFYRFRQDCLGLANDHVSEGRPTA